MERFENLKAVGLKYGDALCEEAVADLRGSNDEAVLVLYDDFKLAVSERESLSDTHQAAIDMLVAVTGLFNAAQAVVAGSMVGKRFGGLPELSLEDAWIRAGRFLSCMCEITEASRADGVMRDFRDLLDGKSTD